MEASVCIEQKGTVESLSGHKMTVKIHREAFCGHCSAKGLCFIGDQTERIIEIDNPEHGFKIGEEVLLAVSRRMGMKAILYAYLLPFVLLITVLIGMSLMKIPEWITGVTSLGILIPYFFILYFLRERMRSTFSLTARKTHS